MPLQKNESLIHHRIFTTPDFQRLLTFENLIHNYEYNY